MKFRKGVREAGLTFAGLASGAVIYALVNGASVEVLGIGFFLLALAGALFVALSFVRLGEPAQSSTSQAKKVPISVFRRIRFLSLFLFVQSALTIEAVGMLSENWILATVGPIVGLTTAASVLLAWHFQPKRLGASGFEW